MRELIVKMKKKYDNKAQAISLLVVLIIAAAVLLLVVFGYLIISGKLGSLIRYVGDLVRYSFGG